MRQPGGPAGGPGLEKLRVCKTQGLIFASQAEQCKSRHATSYRTGSSPAAVTQSSAPISLSSSAQIFYEFFDNIFAKELFQKRSDLFWPKCCAAFANQINQCHVWCKIWKDQFAQVSHLFLSLNL
jgi:hypothetical protein